VGTFERVAARAEEQRREWLLLFAQKQQSGFEEHSPRQSLDAVALVIV
jgi:hypothetical protein